MAEHEERPRTRVKGRLKQTLGNVTGDRHVEAVGVVEAETGHEPDEREEREAELRARLSHGDISDPSVIEEPPTPT